MVKAWTNQIKSDLERYDQTLGTLQHFLKELGPNTENETAREHGRKRMGR